MVGRAPRLGWGRGAQQPASRRRSRTSISREAAAALVSLTAHVSPPGHVEEKRMGGACCPPSSWYVNGQLQRSDSLAHSREMRPLKKKREPSVGTEDWTELNLMLLGSTLDSEAE